MKVMKFGGTSVKDSTAIIRTIGIVKDRYKQAWVVVSAFAGVTNELVKITEQLKNKSFNAARETADKLLYLHKTTAQELNSGKDTFDFIDDIFQKLNLSIGAIEILGEITPKSIDHVISMGEILSSKIIADYSKSINMNSNHVDSRNLIKTDSNFTAAEVDFDSTNIIISNYIKENSGFDYIISGGFIGSNSENITTTLGRGGSDYTAAVYASALKSEVLEIWTDVDGILTSDPRLVNNAKILKQVSYQEAAELAYFGAKVLHPKTIFPAINQNIPVYVLNSYNPEGKGTLITQHSSTSNEIKSISFRRNITLINIISNRMLGAYGFLSKVFEVFNNNETSVDLVSTSEVSISLTIDDTRNISEIINQLSEFANTEVFENKAIISAIGAGIRDTSGIASRFFATLKGINISMITFGASEVNLSIVVKNNDLDNAVKLLHNEFFQD